MKLIPNLSHIGKSRWFRWLSFFTPIILVLVIMGTLLGNVDDLVMSSWTLVCLVTGISIGSVLTWQKQNNVQPDIIPAASNMDMYDKLREEFDTTADSEDGVAPPGGGGI